MADVNNLKPGMTISFELNTKLLAGIYTNVVLQSICDATMARMVGDVDAIHNNIISTLPEGTPASCDEYNFLIVRTIDGVLHPVGVPWIKDPVRIVSKTEISVVVRNVSVDDAAGISAALNAYGYSDIDVKVNSQ